MFEFINPILPIFIDDVYRKTNKYYIEITPKQTDNMTHELTIVGQHTILVSNPFLHIYT